MEHLLSGEADSLPIPTSRLGVLQLRQMTVLPFCREAVSADLPGILRLYGQREFDDGNVLPLSDAERIFALMASYPDYRIYVAEHELRVVGTFALLVMANLGHLGAPSAVIEDVAVDPQWQGRGIGKTMMRFALDVARDKGCYKATLSSNMKRERAHAFYESLGFERHGYSFIIGLEQRR